ncbi:DUF3995 domain-containing protein (plasmid) [Streptomycetaceae bacterium NBC_01309]
MRVRNVRTRLISAPAAKAGELVDRLRDAEVFNTSVGRRPGAPWTMGGATPVRRDRPSVYGGSQSVEEYVPGRLLVLRFTAGQGLEGTQRLEVEARGIRRCRMTHTLDCRVEGKALPAYPLLRRLHDALADDLLDRAEFAATGGQPRVSRRVRAAKALELRIAGGLGLPVPRLQGGPGERLAANPAGERLARVAGRAASGTLAALAGLHAAWALGWRWPGGSDQALAARVLSSTEREELLARTGSELPSAGLTWVVAAALVVAAGAVGATTEGTRSRSLRLATWGVAVVLLARGAVMTPVNFFTSAYDLYTRLDLTLYGPLCIALGSAAALVARRSGRAAAENRVWTHSVPAAGPRHQGRRP